MPVSDFERWRFLSGLLRYLARHRGRLLLGFVCILLSNLFLVGTPWVLKKAIDGLHVALTPERLLEYAGLIVGLTIMEGICRFTMRRLLIGVSRDIEYDLRNDVFEKLEVLAVSFYRRNRTGDLMSRATNDLSNVRMLLGPGIMYSVNTIVTATLVSALMFKISWSLALLTFLPLPFVSYGVRRFGARIHRLTEESQSRLADLSARVQESMAGARVVKAFVQEQPEIREFERLNLALVEKNNEMIRVTSVFHPIMQITFGVAVVVVLLYGGWQVQTNQITRGDVLAFMVYLGLLAWPMIALGWVVNLLERGGASMDRLNHILEAAPEISDSPNVRQDFTIRGEIEFRNLTFAYETEPVLREISLKIPAGKAVAIVGATGSGKSTLVQLIPRLYNAPPRTLFLDGVPIEEIPLERLRRSIGFIPQDTFLFGETVRENIAFGVDNPTDEEVARAARISSIDIDIEEFPNGFETIVGERGITLSGGQKQRTAISRAVIRNPRILILDDALSSVDTYTEERILEELRRVMRDRTSILISHRVSTVKDADEIIVLDDGAIVERGSHEALIRRGGYYAELHRRQLLEEELAVSE
jgi:ATP-binding cassette subfamily B protein